VIVNARAASPASPSSPSPSRTTKQLVLADETVTDEGAQQRGGQIPAQETAAEVAGTAKQYKGRPRLTLLAILLLCATWAMTGATDVQIMGGMFSVPATPDASGDGSPAMRSASKGANLANQKKKKTFNRRVSDYFKGYFKGAVGGLKSEKSSDRPARTHVTVGVI